MKLSDLCEAREISGPAGAAAIAGLTADSREVKPGTLFAALPGTKTDGTRFLADALARGAAAILIAEGASTDAPIPVPVIRDPNPRRRLALMAARFYGRQPETAVAVTGTNGKTSVTAFVRQIWEAQGLCAASLGTTGIITKGEERPLGYTTPDPVLLHASLAQLAAEGVTHLAFEASSHGLAQHRVDGLKLAAGGFTNITRDHLDYHAGFEDYFAAKMRLFTALLAPGQPAVVDLDSPGGAKAAEVARARGLALFTVGRTGETLRLLSAERDGFEQLLRIGYDGRDYAVRSPLAGEFQTANVLVAAGLALATGSAPEAIFRAVEHLKGAKGRLELAGRAPCGAPVFIDYAHTPDALEHALQTLRPYAAGRLIVIFGCGGDRDRGKRPQMGEIAARAADLVIVTDDNPRSEDAAAIRAEVLAGAPGAEEIGGREQAIRHGVALTLPGDVLLIAGKGHETGQIIGQTVIPYSDHDAVASGLKALQE
jgi:UDP-N-acetylmuramoyl-L-alanyl-D-glutamate--2,6-diaminopimelate ligase